MERVSDYLIADHARLRGLLAVAAAGAAVEPEAFAAFRAGLLRHIGIEEKLLFPAVRDGGGAALAERLRALHVEHAAISSLLVPAPDLALCGELAGLLAAHDAQEEGLDGVYAACEVVLGAAASEALGARARAAPAVRPDASTRACRGSPTSPTSRAGGTSSPGSLRAIRW